MNSQLPTSSTYINKWSNVEKWVLVLLSFMEGQICFFMVANKRCLDFPAPEEHAILAWPLILQNDQDSLKWF